MSPLYSLNMNIEEKMELSQIIRKLWVDFFPQSNTPASEVPRVMANRDWIRDCLIFYGWPTNENKTFKCDMRYVDGAAILYMYGHTPCALVTVDDSGDEPKLRFTYVDIRTQ